jgi:hypothetical protein
MTNIQVKSHTRRKPEKPAVYIETHAKLQAEVAAMNRTNDFRESIGYERHPSQTETMFSRSVRAFSEFVSQLGVSDAR